MSVQYTYRRKDIPLEKPQVSINCILVTTCSSCPSFVGVTLLQRETGKGQWAFLLITESTQVGLMLMREFEFESRFNALKAMRR